MIAKVTLWLFKALQTSFMISSGFLEDMLDEDRAPFLIFGSPGVFSSKDDNLCFNPFQIPFPLTLPVPIA